MRDWLPLDLLVVGAVAAATPAVTSLSVPEGTPLQVVVGAAFVLFAPGYALVSFALPARRTADHGTDRADSVAVGLPERLLLAVGVSIPLVALTGVVLNYSPWGLGPRPLLLAVAVPTVALSAGAAVRRWRVSPDRRFRVGPTGAPARLWAWVGGAGSQREAHLNVLLLFGVVLAVAGIGTAIATSGGGERYTEFYLGTEDAATGELTAGEYPTELRRGQAAEFVVGVTNREHATREYTVVAELQRVRDGQVVQQSQVAQFTRTVAHNGSLRREVVVRPEMTGENLRLSYLLYRGTPPEEPSSASASRHLYVWVDVAGPETSAAAQASVTISETRR
jgi:uncharacterized membrane protein